MSFNINNIIADGKDGSLRPIRHGNLFKNA
jgi:hypothetical protein